MLRLKGQLLSGLELMLWTPQFVVLKNAEGQEITLKRDGRMIIRKAPSQPVAERVANEVIAVVANLQLDK